MNEKELTLLENVKDNLSWLVERIDYYSGYELKYLKSPKPHYDLRRSKL